MNPSIFPMTRVKLREWELVINDLSSFLNMDIMFICLHNLSTIPAVSNNFLNVHVGQKIANYRSDTRNTDRNWGIGDFKTSYSLIWILHKIIKKINYIISV